MENIFLLTGSNLGNREENLKMAARKIEVDCEVLRRSSMYESEAWGMPGSPDFLNQVLSIKTDLEPLALLESLQKIEKSMGRDRSAGPLQDRVIDIDILFFGTRVIESEKLNLPHPEIANRKFALEPLAEIEPEWNHPVTLQSMESMLSHCPDKGWIRKYSET